jgi:hypothetical protein
LFTGNGIKCINISTAIANENQPTALNLFNYRCGPNAITGLENPVFTAAVPVKGIDFAIFIPDKYAVAMQGRIANYGTDVFKPVDPFQLQSLQCVPVNGVVVRIVEAGVGMACTPTGPGIPIYRLETG